VTIDVQCTSCHTRYRIDEQVLPEGTPTFKCSRCGHVFSIEPRAEARSSKPADEAQRARNPAESRAASESAPPEAATASAGSQSPREEASPSRATESAPPPDPPRADPPPATNVAREAPPKTANAEVRARPTTAELFSRSFNLDDMRSDEGENLSFDFRDDPELADPERADRHEPTGEAAPPRPAATRQRTVPDPAPRPLEVDAFTPAPDFAIGDPDLSETRRTRSRKPRREEFLDETAAPVYNRGVTHSSRFFLALFAFVALGFAGTTMTIHAAPAVARDLLSRLPVVGSHFVSPLTPARIVALQNVRTEYLRSKGGRPALVVQGDARNLSAGTLHTIRITAHFDLAPGVAGTTRDAYCGNSLGAQMINQMTPHEIEFYQRLPPPGGFTLAAAAACPFVIVLLDPPTVQGLQLAVTEAEPAAIALSSQPGS
jgi:predicted Zn finger-like uncharacterized protein